MSNHPVRFRVEPSAPRDRVHVAIRLALLVALGAVGYSTIYWVLYLALPAIAAALIADGGGERYRAARGPQIVRVLRWIAGAYAYLWLLTDALPAAEPGGPVELEVELAGAPTAGQALLRLLYSLPALVLLAILSFALFFVWIVGAIAVLATRRLPEAVADFLALTLRFQMRLAAYHLSLVDRYPSFEEAPRTTAATGAPA